MTTRAPRLPALAGALALCVLLPALIVISVRTGLAFELPLRDIAQGSGALLGWSEPLPGDRQVILQWRLWRALTASGVGGALALSGALLQGLFRNGLAEPAVLGITAGATLGAATAILALGGYGGLVLAGALPHAPGLVPVAALIGALGTALLVTLLASPGGRPSVPALLLTGIAVNAAIGGLLALIGSLVLSDWDVSRALTAWTFGTLEDRSASHVATVWAGVALAAALIPFLARELDLIQAGEEDARALGVDTGRVRLLAVLGSSVAAAAAVSVAGTIAFVGLVVPHLLRLLVGRAHRAVLPLSLLGGACFLLGVDAGQRALLGGAALQPGVTMSLVGGPFFLVLLLLHRRELDTW
jgi:iron complex transport system permease protein